MRHTCWAVAARPSSNAAGIVNCVLLVHSETNNSTIRSRYYIYQRPTEVALGVRCKCRKDPCRVRVHHAACWLLQEQQSRCKWPLHEEACPTRHSTNLTLSHCGKSGIRAAAHELAAVACLANNKYQIHRCLHSALFWFPLIPHWAMDLCVCCVCGGRRSSQPRLQVVPRNGLSDQVS